jgi:class 3 adenylate cyclase
VVVGELGSVKKEIALQGDTLSTAVRLVDACRDSGEVVIASADLLDQLLPPDIAVGSLGPIRLRGKEQAIEVWRWTPHWAAVRRSAEPYGFFGTRPCADDALWGTGLGS